MRYLGPKPWLMILSSLHIAPSGPKGRGVFTREPIEPGKLVEIAPVLVLDAKDRTLIDQTLLHDYIFEWGDVPGQCCMALGYLPLYNHSFQSNCEYEMDYDQLLIRVRSVRFISRGEELSINYNGDWNNINPVWFETR
jgi:hypothetical protein